MQQTTETRATTSEAAIFSRLLSNGTGDLTPALARYILGLGFTKGDRARMEELAEKNQAGEASAEEKEELFGYVKAGHLLAILQSKARKSLKKKVRGR